MIIICGDCGKKYRLDPVKLQGRAARFKCKSCNHLIQLPDPEQMRAGSAADGSGAEQVSPTDATDQAQKRWIDKELDGIQASPNHGGLGTENAEQLVTYPADAIEDDGAE